MKTFKLLLGWLFFFIFFPITIAHAENVTATWQDPNPLSVNVTHYTVKVYEVNGLGYSEFRVNVPNLSLVLDLVPGSYQVNVTASNSVGESAPSNLVEIVINPAPPPSEPKPPAAPTNLQLKRESSPAPSRVKVPQRR